MYLAYLDDSDTRAKNQQWQVLTAVLVSDHTFSALEGFTSFVIADLLPESQMSTFEEFHACELYGGYGTFKEITQDRRFKAIEGLLGLIASLGARISYGAVNLEWLNRQPFASANPLDISFRLCAQGIEDWLQKRDIELIHAQDTLGGNMALFIADDGDRKNKSVLQDSFRSMRCRVRTPLIEASNLAHVHDDMYFGDSKYSIGIQLADLCSYFIARHLCGDQVTEPFFKMIEPQIVSGRRQEQQWESKRAGNAVVKANDFSDSSQDFRMRHASSTLREIWGSNYDSILAEHERISAEIDELQKREEL